MKKEYTTIYKGIAIISIILSHFMGTFGNGITVFTPLGGIGVAIFLLLSAYGLNESWLEKNNQGGVRYGGENDLFRFGFHIYSSS